MTETHSIFFGEDVIEFTVLRRDRATLEIAVEPDQSVVVAAPFDAPVDVIMATVKKRAAWVKRQQRFFFQYVPRTPERKFLPGETHLYLGRQYRLKVEESTQEFVRLDRNFIWVQSCKPALSERTRTIVEAWYNEQAHVMFKRRLGICLDRFPDRQAFTPKGLIVRNLKQRWGSMSSGACLMLNRRLIEAPIDAIDYVIAHELCHIAIPHHGSKFFDLLGRVMPDWENRKQKLEQVMA